MFIGQRSGENVKPTLTILTRCIVSPPPSSWSSRRSYPAAQGRPAPALSEVGVGQRAGANRVEGWLDPYRANAEKLIAAAQADQFAWDRLAELTDTFGQRLSGSDNLNRAIAWAVETMKKDGLENVHTERVMVPRWVRGNESLEITDPPHHVVPMLGLGGSVATPPAGVEAEVMVVANGDELTKRARRSEGQDRALQRAVHELRRDGRSIDPAARRWRRGTARWPRWCAPSVRWACARRTPAA